MKRSAFLVVCCAASMSCCGEGEKISVPPLPQDGGAIPYAQVLTRLAAQTNSAKEDHFLNRWDGVVDSATSLELSVGYLMKAPDLPPTHKASIEKASVELKANIVKLREAAMKHDQADSLDLIRRLHNQIRTLQDMK
jgi:hypothetical protein